MGRARRWAAVATGAMALGPVATAHADLALLAPQRIPLPESAIGLAGGDLNGDGRVDLAVLVGPGAGGLAFLSAAAPALPIAPNGLSGLGVGPSPLAADVTGDGRVDLVGPGGVVLPGDGAGGLGPPLPQNGRGLPDGHIRLADVNRDGRLDLVGIRTAPATSGPPSSVAVVALNAGAGAFADGVEVAPALGGGPDLALGDLNGDGAPDLVRLIDRASQPLPLKRSIAVSLSAGAGGFAAPSLLDTDIGTVVISQPATPRAVALGDLDGDDLLDLVVADAAGRLTVRPGDGAGGFGEPSSFLAGPLQPSFVAVADLSGDGQADVVVAGPASVAVLRGTGAGRRLAAPELQDTGSTLSAPVIADLDGDGDLDLASIDSDPSTRTGPRRAPTLLVLRSAERLAVAANRVQLSGVAGGTLSVSLDATVGARVDFRLLGAGRVYRRGTVDLGSGAGGIALRLPARRGRYTLEIVATTPDGQVSRDRALIAVTGGRR